MQKRSYNQGTLARLRLHYIVNKGGFCRMGTIILEELKDVPCPRCDNKTLHLSMLCGYQYICMSCGKRDKMSTLGLPKLK